MAGRNLFAEPAAPTKGRNLFESPSLYDRAGAALLGAGQSLPVTDEMGAALGAAASYPVLRATQALSGGSYDAPSLDQLYTSGLKDTRDQIKKAADETPIEYYGGMIAGSLGTGLAGSATKTGASLASRLGSGGVGARIAKGVGAGAASGGAYGFSSGEGGLDERLSSAGQAAVLGGAVGGVLPAAGAIARGVGAGINNMALGAGARGGEALDEALGGIKSISNQAYKQMRDTGAVINKDASQKIVGAISSAIKSSGPLNKKIHGNTLSILSDLQKVSKKGELGLEELDQFRQIFGEMSGDFVNKSNARVAGIARNAIDDALDSLDDTAFTAGSKDALDALKLGRQEFARARKFETISDIVKKSEGDALYVKRELTKLVNDPKKMRGYNAEERTALKEAARLSGGEAVLKIAGKFGFDPSRLGSGVGAGFGAGAAGVIGGAGPAALVPALGTASKYGLKLSTRGKTEKLLKAIEGTAKTNLPAKLGSTKTPVVGSTLTGMAGANVPPMIQGKSPTQITINPAMQGREGVPDVELPQIAPQSSLPESLRENEGLRYQTYYDTKGNRTVGYGFNLDSGIAKKVWKAAGVDTPFEDVYNGRAAINDVQAEALGRASYQVAANDAVSLYPDLTSYSPSRQEALLDMSYHFGKPQLAKMEPFNAAIKKGDWMEAARQLGKTAYHKNFPDRSKDNIRKLIRES